jgi:hypothetical protein
VSVPNVNSSADASATYTPEQLIEDPVGTFAGSMTRMYATDPDHLEVAQRAGLQLRFAQLRDAIPLLTKVAERQHVDTIEELDDVVPLLFDHTHYKSYPASLIDRRRFGDLTRWLSRLTTVDVSQLDADGCESIDEWLDLLDRETELRVTHSSGTAGSLSLIPWSKSEFDTLGQVFCAAYTQDFGVDEDCRQTPGMHVLFPYFRRGGAMLVRLNDPIEDAVAKGPERFHAAFPGRLSSDVMYLAGRLRAATARGQAHQLKVDEQLLARKEEFDRLLAEMPQRLEQFLGQMTEELAGERVFTMSVWHTVYNFARSGLAKGTRQVFASNSVLALGGGAKGLVQPPGWEDDVLEFFGADRIRSGYGMTEITLAAPVCSHGHYHFAPWIVPFVLDPATSAPLPRTGAQTGRAAFFDLAVKTRWGGFITGDRITLHHDHHCPCGQTTFYCERDIQRIADQLDDGEDKITCAATESAHEETLEFLSMIDG